MAQIIRALLVVLLAGLGLVTQSVAADQTKRPRVLGVAYMALYVSDLGAARAFYEDFSAMPSPTLSSATTDPIAWSSSRSMSARNLAHAWQGNRSTERVFHGAF